MSLVQKVLSKASNPAALPLMAVSQGTYIYPLQGAFYFLRNPSLWGNLLGMVLPQIVLSIAVLVFCHMFLFPPQAALAIFFNGPTGLITSWIATIQQAMALTMALSEIMLMPAPLRMLFDAILTKEGHDRLVTTGNIRRDAEESYHERIVRFVKRLPQRIIFPFWMARLLFNVLLTFIPIVGPIISVLVNATGVGARCQERYFELKGYAAPELKRYIQTRRGQLFAFGLVAATLEQIPFLGVFFVFTNTVGGALWAVDTESALNPVVPVPRKNRIRSTLLED
ncbi:Outer spore wall protein RRT8 [Wickerhamiella sorbophila]|uniref:Outer spore wall protein RRT8 n=1 Tax=Wickerhamiella sorbophila TaxID=45607 RepID=A0A2T0FHJ9_9ASCO|nr:Outer spore wall protein RRT8 [Wickerhamiella sorbophila]PRT54473.1 Outer spore wall protein RRT8 [Wickerhamiella sorbophila]